MENSPFNVMAYRFQSTRPRGRTRRLELLSIPCDRVSIHASSREDATLRDNLLYIANWFQSTRPRGRTRLPSTLMIHLTISFNPRVLAGGRDVSC